MTLVPDTVWTVTEHRGPEGFAALEAEWRRLYSEMPDPQMWHSHEAYSAYLEHLCPAPALFRCFALSDGERVRAILPVEERVESGIVGGRGGLRLRVWGLPLGLGWPTTDAVGPEDDARRALLPAVFEALRQDPARPAVFDTGRVHAETALWEGLAGLPDSRWFRFHERGEYVVPTDVTKDEFLARLNSKQRQNLRRYAARFEALEGASHVRARGGGELAREFEDLLEVEGSGWKGREGTSIRQNPAVAAFYRCLIERMRLDGHCEVQALHAEGRCLAAAFCVFTGRTCTVLKSGYDETYGAASPGKLNAQRTFETCCDDPEVDQVNEVADAAWLRQWDPGVNGIDRCYVALRPVAGALILPFLRFWYGPLRSTVRAARTRLDRLRGQSGGARGREAV